MPEHGLVDPVQRAVAGSIVASPGMPRLAGRRIGFLDNRKPGGAQLLRCLAAELERRWGIEAEQHAKPDTTIVPDEIYRDLSVRCHGIVTGLGD